MAQFGRDGFVREIEDGIASALGGERAPRRAGLVLAAFVLILAVCAGSYLGATGLASLNGSGAGDGVAIEQADGSDPEPESGDAEEDAEQGAGEERREPEPPIVVDVSGAVASPGVVEVPGGSRVDEAIAAAGGLAPDADVDAINRAAVVEDGMKIVVPREGETGSAAVATGATGSEGSGTTELVNINSATLEELDALPGVGPATAQAIIEDREANGPFTSPEDIMRVSGIGEKKYERLEGLVCV